jgi:hypothetical protein
MELTSEEEKIGGTTTSFDEKLMEKYITEFFRDAPIDTVLSLLSYRLNDEQNKFKADHDTNKRTALLTYLSETLICRQEIQK